MPERPAHPQKQRGPAGGAGRASLRRQGGLCGRPAPLASAPPAFGTATHRGPPGPSPPAGQGPTRSPPAGRAAKGAASAASAARRSRPRAPRRSRGPAQRLFPVGCCPCSQACGFSPVAPCAAGPPPRLAGSPSPPAAPTCPAPLPRPHRVPGAARLTGRRGGPGLTFPTGNRRSAFRTRPREGELLLGVPGGTAAGG